MRVISRRTSVETSSPKMAASVEPSARPPRIPMIIPSANGFRQGCVSSLTCRSTPASLDPYQHLRLIPQRLKPVERTLGGIEDVHDHVAVVEQHPAVIGRTLAFVHGDVHLV